KQDLELPSWVLQCVGRIGAVAPGTCAGCSLLL
ncbi:hypothetical protein A2U01_0095629, partial [Trifolium medium]|nr:hypothetical protein [Trifolium medium]